MDTKDFLLNDELKNCSFFEDELVNNCSFNELDTCGDGSVDVKGKIRIGKKCCK